MIGNRTNMIGNRARTIHQSRRIKRQHEDELVKPACTANFSHSMRGTDAAFSLLQAGPASGSFRPSPSIAKPIPAFATAR
jgi:hypothetical protein